MKIWLKENWFKIGVLVVILIVGFFIVNYFYNVLPKQQSLEKTAEWQLKCEEYGKDKYGDTYYVDDFGYISRKYYFSPRLNACVMSLERFSHEDDFRTLSLVNMFSGYTQFEYSSNCNEVGQFCLSHSDFYEKLVDLIME